MYVGGIIKMPIVVVAADRVQHKFRPAEKTPNRTKKRFVGHDIGKDPIKEEDMMNCVAGGFGNIVAALKRLTDLQGFEVTRPQSLNGLRIKHVGNDCVSLQFKITFCRLG